MAYPDPKIVTVTAPTNTVNTTRPNQARSARSTVPTRQYVVILSGGQHSNWVNPSMTKVGLTCTNAYPDFLGVKGSQVQILSSRQEGDRPADLENIQVSEPFSLLLVDHAVSPTMRSWGPLGDRGALRYAVSESPAAATVAESGCR